MGDQAKVNVGTATERVKKRGKRNRRSKKTNTTDPCGQKANTTSIVPWSNSTASNSSYSLACSCSCFRILDPYPALSGTAQVKSCAQHYCRVCNIQLNSCRQSKIHGSGKKHEKRLSFMKLCINSGETSLLENCVPLTDDSMCSPPEVCPSYSFIPYTAYQESHQLPAPPLPPPVPSASSQNLPLLHISNPPSLQNANSVNYYYQQPITSTIVNNCQVEIPGGTHPHVEYQQQNNVVSTLTVPPSIITTNPYSALVPLVLPPTSQMPPTSHSTSVATFVSLPPHSYTQLQPPPSRYQLNVPNSTCPSLTSGFSGSGIDSKSNTTETGSILSSCGSSLTPALIPTTTHSIGESTNQLLQFPYLNQPPPPLISQSYCSLCRLDFPSISALENHLRGVRHSRRLRSQQAFRQLQRERGDGVMRFEDDDIHCDMCKVKLNSSHQLQAHLIGYKHEVSCRSKTVKSNTINRDLLQPKSSKRRSKRSKKRSKTISIVTAESSPSSLNSHLSSSITTTSPSTNAVDSNIRKKYSSSSSNTSKCSPTHALLPLPSSEGSMSSTSSSLYSSFGDSSSKQLPNSPHHHKSMATLSRSQSTATLNRQQSRSMSLLHSPSNVGVSSGVGRCRSSSVSSGVEDDYSSSTPPPPPISLMHKDDSTLLVTVHFITENKTRNEVQSNEDEANFTDECIDEEETHEQNNKKYIRGTNDGEKDERNKIEKKSRKKKKFRRKSDVVKVSLSSSDKEKGDDVLGTANIHVADLPISCSYCSALDTKTTQYQEVRLVLVNNSICVHNPTTTRTRFIDHECFEVVGDAADHNQNVISKIGSP